MSQVSPVAFVEATLAYQKTAAIRAAIGFDLFTIINAGDDTIDALAAKIGASKRGLRILCDFLTVHGFLEKSGDRYASTPSSRTFLDRKSPAYMGSIVEFHAAPEMCSLFLSDPMSFVRDGGTVGLGSVAPDHPLWSIFAEAMAPVMTPLAATVAKQIAGWEAPPRKVLDVAAGHGVFGIAIAKAIAGAEVTALDWPGILDIAKCNADAAGVGASFRGLPGSAFDVDWGTGYDLVLLANFLHHFDEPTCISLLKKTRASLGPGGKAVVIEFVPNEDRISPPFEASFAFYMLGSTPGGDAFTAAELAAMAQAAGFKNAVTKPLPRSAQSLTVFEQ
ncbi:MAG TPA: class I SAM-dependent methyltransferase [Xanthobacteraceae bacterium]|nr:class I SAM-dependent methyltransferase [Xanthobacteraceae bacterium]